MTISSYQDITDQQIVTALKTLTAQQLLEVVAFLLVRNTPRRADLVQHIIQIGKNG